MNRQLHEPSNVCELQGLYGPLQILEGKVQQVWALQEIQRGQWRTRDGRHLRVHQPGRWNRGSGPDFKEAVIELDDQRITGDVEIHLYREDWWRHGHHLDPRYNAVNLHVVLFAGGIERKIMTESGRSPEEWIMGPWMREDIESVSGGEPGLFGELVPELREWLESDHPRGIRHRLKSGADRRWQQKEGMARCFVENYGIDGALHRMMLYYLGFPYNRRSFFEMAEKYPPERWRCSNLLDSLRVEWEDRICWGMGRPANRAEIRLRQYLDLNCSSGSWIRNLVHIPAGLQDSLKAALRGNGNPEDTRELRKTVRYPDWVRWMHREVLGGVLSGSLVDRLWVDVLLPVLAATGHLGMEEGALLWFHSRSGSFPEAYRQLLRLVEVQKKAGMPLCNGWTQGLVWAEDQLRLERVRSTLGDQHGPAVLGGA